MTKFKMDKVLGDQSCLTALNRKYLAIASGNGTVQLHDIHTLKRTGMSREHDMVIKGICFLGEHRVVTGTPECSYHIQKAVTEWNYTPFLIVLLLFVSMLIKI